VQFTQKFNKGYFIEKLGVMQFIYIWDKEFESEREEDNILCDCKLMIFISYEIEFTSYLYTIYVHYLRYKSSSKNKL